MKLYLVQLSDSQSSEYFFKVGVTTRSAKDRFAYGSTKVVDSDLSLGDKLNRIVSGVGYIPDCKYGVEELHSVDYRLEYDAYLGEQRLLSALSPLSYRPQKLFSGATECFKPPLGKEVECSARVIAIMDADSKQRNADAPGDLKYKLLGLLVSERDPMKRHLTILEKYRQELLNEHGA